MSPFVQVAILFVFPVALATWSHGRLWGSVVAVALPIVRLPFLQLERYIADRSEAKFTHTFCPDCARPTLATS